MPKKPQINEYSEICIHVLLKLYDMNTHFDVTFWNVSRLSNTHTKCGWSLNEDGLCIIMFKERMRNELWIR